MRTVNAVIYARYSSHGQTEQSIEGQLHDAYAFAEREGYTIVAEYIDRALTGRSDNRADFQRMIADSAKHTFEAVLVWKLDRFARNRYDSAIYKAKLKRNGVKVVSVMENLTDTPEGIILEGMLESMAEYYSANLSVNVKRGLRETLAKGKFAGGRVPFGFKLQDGKLVPHETNALIVKHLFEQYANGVSKKQIIAEMRESGTRSPEGLPLGNTSFQHTLTSTVYIGLYQRNGVIYEDCAAPIIEKDLFDRVQARISRVKRAPAAAKAREEYLLQGKAFCGRCGMPMHGESGKSHTGAIYTYYACSGKKKHRSCRKKNEKKHNAERYVVEQTVTFVLTPRNISRIASQVVSEAQKEFAASKIPAMERAVRQLDQDLNKLIDALIDAPKSAHKRIYERIDLLEAQKSDLESDIAKQRIASNIQYTEDDVRAWLYQFCDGDIADPAFCKRIIDVFVNSVYFYDDRIVIFYNVRGANNIIPPHPAVTKGSDLTALAPPSDIKSEPAIVVIEGVFGFVFSRSKL